MRLALSRIGATTVPKGHSPHPPESRAAAIGLVRDRDIADEIVMTCPNLVGNER